jgi:hypothetical protein
MLNAEALSINQKSLFSLLSIKTNMKNLLLFCIAGCTLFVSCTPSATTDTSKEEWMQLFNRKDLSGWDIKITKHDLNDNFKNTFRVVDSIMKIDYSEYEKFDGQFGHIYYKEPFSYYKVRVEYRFTGQQLADGPWYGKLNSGVMLHSQSASSLSKDQTFPVSLEMQLLANDGEETKTTANLCTPGTQVSIRGTLVPAHCISSTSKNYAPADWVKAEAIVFGDSIIYHVVNGDTVLKYEHPIVGGGFVNEGLTWLSGGFNADSTLWIQKQGSPLTAGYIALQAESHPLEFRKVELLNLEGCMDKSAVNYKSYFIKADNSKCKYK